MKTLTVIAIVFLMSSCDIVIVTPNFDPRNQITGTYNVNEYSQTYNSSTGYYITISKVGPGNDIYVENLYNASIAVQATLNGSSVLIPFQVQDGYEIEGAGTLSGGHLSLTYSVHDTYNDWDTDFCKSEAWRE